MSYFTDPIDISTYAHVHQVLVKVARLLLLRNIVKTNDLLRSLVLTNTDGNLSKAAPTFQGSLMRSGIGQADLPEVGMAIILP